MTSTSATIAEAAERLSPAERVRLVARLLESLDKADPEIDRAWAGESERRLDARLRGEITARPAADVLAKHLKP